jgi:hypothetical protein
MSLYLRTRMRKSRVRAAIEIREDGAEYSAFALKAPHDSQAAQSIDALEAIAQAIGVSPEKLRISDRFGYEIGTRDALDDTLDLVGALLLNRRKVTRNPLSLSDVKTVGDFLIAWRHSHVA